MEILESQFLHLPFWTIKLNRGISSRHFKYFPQEKHFDLSFTIDLPVLYLKITTLRKLPIIIPKIKIKKKAIKLILTLVKI